MTPNLAAMDARDDARLQARFGGTVAQARAAQARYIAALDRLPLEDITDTTRTKIEQSLRHDAAEITEVA